MYFPHLINLIVVLVLIKLKSRQKLWNAGSNKINFNFI
jgi:hypothetical protein